MLTHVVMWRLHADNAVQRAERIAAIVEAFEALRGHLPGLLDLRVGGNQADDENAWDLALVTVFESPAALARYDADPRHQAIKQMVRPWRSNRAVVDWAH
jgi:hypothetical protein